MSGVLKLVAPRGCKGCLAAGHAVAHRDENGRLMPGHTANGLGRPNGRPNDRTREANALLKEHAKTAAQVIVDGLGSSVDWVRYGAAKTILERTIPKHASDGEPVDVDWIQWATAEELDELIATMERCRRRRDAGALRDDGDAFSLASLPAPGDQQPEPEPIDVTPEPDDDAEEFGP